MIESAARGGGPGVPGQLPGCVPEKAPAEHQAFCAGAVSRRGALSS